jgi:ankyrin repeat protein
MLRTGPLPDTFEWLVRAHALGQRIPYPVSDDGAATFEAAPALAFSGFGKAIFCATKSWAPPPMTRPLRSDGALIRAVRNSDHAEIRRIVEGGAEVDAPATFGGYTALHLAVVLQDAETFRLLRELGASTRTIVDRGMHALGIAIVHDAPMEIFESLADGDLDLALQNGDGFNGLHAAAETNRARVVPWLVAHGVPLEARTRHGHTALHIAGALGHVDAACALLDAGADPEADSPGGTPLEVARAQEKPETVALLEARRR